MLRLAKMLVAKVTETSYFRSLLANWRPGFMWPCAGNVTTRKCCRTIAGGREFWALVCREDWRSMLRELNEDGDFEPQARAKNYFQLHVDSLYL